MAEYHCSNCRSTLTQVEFEHILCLECGHKTSLAEGVPDVPAGTRFDRVTTTEDMHVGGKS